VRNSGDTGSVLGGGRQLSCDSDTSERAFWSASAVQPLPSAPCSPLIAGVGRTSLAMARENDLPRWLAAVHPRFHIPRRAEVALAAVVCSIVVAVDLRGAIGFSSFGVLTYYLIANLAGLTEDGSYRRYPHFLANPRDHWLRHTGGNPAVEVGGRSAPQSSRSASGFDFSSYARLLSAAARDTEACFGCETPTSSRPILGKGRGVRSGAGWALRAPRGGRWGRAGLIRCLAGHDGQRHRPRAPERGSR
jgi:hypothetical protein